MTVGLSLTVKVRCTCKKGVEKDKRSREGTVLEEKTKRKATSRLKREMIIPATLFTHTLLFSVISSSYQFIWITINRTISHTTTISAYCLSMCGCVRCNFTCKSKGYPHVLQNRSNWHVSIIDISINLYI